MTENNLENKFQQSKGISHVDFAIFWPTPRRDFNGLVHGLRHPPSLHHEAGLTYQQLGVRWMTICERF
jgi:hypothetical protein